KAAVCPPCAPLNSIISAKRGKRKSDRNPVTLPFHSFCAAEGLTIILPLFFPALWLELKIHQHPFHGRKSARDWTSLWQYHADRSSFCRATTGRRLIGLPKFA